MLEAGTVGGFHYGGACNGLLRATDRQHTDGRQIYACDVCGSEAVERVRTKEQIDAENRAWFKALQS